MPELKDGKKFTHVHGTLVTISLAPVKKYSATIIFIGSCWDNYVEMANELGWNAVVPILKRPFSRHRFSDYIDDLLRAIGSEGLDIKECVIFGHSMVGGLLAQRLAEVLTIIDEKDTAKVKALVLISSGVPKGISFWPWGLIRRILFHLSYMHALIANQPLYLTQRDVAELLFNKKRLQDVPGMAQQNMLPVYESGSVVREILLRQIEIDENRIKCPVTVIVGAEDGFIRARSQHELAIKYRACHRVIDGGSHMLIVGDDWQKTASFIFDRLSHNMKSRRGTLLGKLFR